MTPELQRDDPRSSNCTFSLPWLCPKGKHSHRKQRYPTTTLTSALYMYCTFQHDLGIICLSEAMFIEPSGATGVRCCDG